MVQKLILAVIDHSHIGCGTPHPATNAKENKSAEQDGEDGCLDALLFGREIEFAGSNTAHIEKENRRKQKHKQYAGYKIARTYTVYHACRRGKVVEYSGIYLKIPKRIKTRIAHENQCTHQRNDTIVYGKHQTHFRNFNPNVKEHKKKYRRNEVARGGCVKRQAVEHNLQAVGYAASVSRQTIVEHENKLPQNEIHHYGNEKAYQKSKMFLHIKNDLGNRVKVAAYR